MAIQNVLFRLFVFTLFTPHWSAAMDTNEYETLSSLNYRKALGLELDSYQKEACLLDLYYPKNGDGFASIVWFHSGGLTQGRRHIPDQLKGKGIAIIAVGYRLSPQVSAPAYIEDAAASVAWTFQNIEKFGGSKKKIFVAGHSAGGYLTSMVGLDKKWLAKFGIEADDIAGLIPYSGHSITHMTVRKERGISDKQPIIDEYAPLFHVRENTPPMLLISGDREMEMLGRYEETAYFWRMFKVAGNHNVRLLELKGYDHGAMCNPAHDHLLKFISTVQQTLEKPRQHKIDSQ